MTPLNTPYNPSSLSFSLEPTDSRRLAILSGQFGAHLKQIEKRMEVEVIHRGSNFAVNGSKAENATKIIQQLYKQTTNGQELTPDEVHLAIQESLMESVAVEDAKQALDTASIIRTKKCTIKPRGGNQKGYVAAVRTNDINFGIGPAGTGKTYLAVACAVEALLKDEVERILLVRPAVEAGEKLGFLPGDLAQKVDPYLRPLYDALYEMLGFETVAKFIERNVIEVAPLAYMRGRTLNNSFIILDESQNTTREQMKMFLTRIGFGSTAVITGDPSQIDLPRGIASGLKHAIEVLDNVEGVSFTLFTAKDVVRHPIVQRIVEAYEAAEKRAEKNN
ncbi:PhoH family protein [Teredinibacter franksiae]|uniref:PhoH family protein n=1 Tax=Teredinibacter franksiae TaxID=2761453 RepID=UPI0035E44224